SPRPGPGRGPAPASIMGRASAAPRLSWRPRRRRPMPDPWRADLRAGAGPTARIRPPGSGDGRPEPRVAVAGEMADVARGDDHDVGGLADRGGAGGQDDMGVERVG